MINKLQDWRGYFLNSMYLPGIHTGIQTAHTVGELFVKYPRSTMKSKMLDHWAKHHKTIICLNGGYLSAMNEFYDFISRDENPYPFAKFHESDEALGGIMTNVGIILPEKIFAANTTLLRGIKYLSWEKARNVKFNSMIDLFTEIHCGNVDDTEYLEFQDKFGVITAFDAELIDRIGKFRLAI
jgi:hypothetical protein